MIERSELLWRIGFAIVIVCCMVAIVRATWRIHQAAKAYEAWQAEMIDRAKDEFQVAEPLPFGLESRRSEMDAIANHPRASRGEGFAINWTSDGLEGAEPLSVLRACANQMEYLQSTPRGSDQNARALFAVLQAIDSLQGTTEVSAPIEDTE